MKKLTERQEQVLALFKRLSIENGLPPTSSDIARQLDIGRTSAYEHLYALFEKGKLEKDDKSGLFLLPRSERDKLLLIPVALYDRIEDYFQKKEMDTIAIPSSMKESSEEELFALICHTEEMVGDGILPKDTLVFSKAEEASDQDIVLALIYGEDESEEVVLRRYRRRSDNVIELTPSNDSMGRITTRQVHILARLRAKMRIF